MSTARTAVVVLLVLLVTASLALAADPYFKSGAPAPSAKPAPAPAATTATPPPAPAPTEGAPAKDGKAPPTTKTTPAPAATTASSTFLGQPGEIGAWDSHGNPITKPAYLASPDAAKVRAIVKGMGPDWRLDSHDRQLRQIRNLKRAFFSKFKFEYSTSDEQLAEFALEQYNDAKSALDLLFKWVIGLSLAVIALVVCVGVLFIHKQNKPIRLDPPTTEDVT